MPRYFFDVFDGEDISRDEVGIDLDHEDMAAEHAVAALPDMAHDELPDGPQRDFWVKVRNGNGEYTFAADLKFKADWLKRRG
ncbi:DUF6894 family protein [Mesorhizobium yinganensis]|uniref:DUF6894 family protein n=1 Tax=Mesorhizobium yinganensis TaxID=3157707 RepID=UPI0032B85E91